MGMSIEEYAVKQTEQAMRMLSEDTDWKSRLLNEYKELKARYNRLKAYNNKQTVLRHTQPTTMKVEDEYRDMLMKDQQHVMGEYLHILELRMTNDAIEYED